MGKNLNKKIISLGVLIFVLNVIMLLALVFIMVEINEGLNAIKYIVNSTNQVIFVGATVIILSCLVYAYFYFECRDMLRNVTKLIECFLLLDLALITSFLMGKYIDPNARPFAFFAIMAATLLGRREAIFVNLVYSLILFVIDINLSSANIMEMCACFLITFCAGTTVIFFSHRIKSRIQSILLVFLLLIPIELIIGVTEVIFSDDMVKNVILLGYGGVGALSSILMYMLLLPVFEIIFSELTIFRLRELTSDDAKLIKKLKNEAPGTYNHTIVVAQLCEACAIAIGENGELARAVAFYHDVGKLKNPEMFTENQTEYNLHNELSPELSADIIRSHARDGAQLIRKNHLPAILADVAVEHHGTLPVKYFYIKALKMSDGEINAANYSYSGPTPQTRISAIVMIADAAEAVTRSLKDRSLANVEKMIKNLIEERMDLEQFVNCDITMRELTIIAQTMAYSLCGVYHSRIAYPKLKMSKKEN